MPSFSKRHVVLVAAGLFLPASGSIAAECPTGEVPIGARCLSAKTVADDVRAIIKGQMAAQDLNAVIVSVQFGDTPILTEAWGDSMSGVPATVDMHFRNGAVAITYMGIVLLQLQERGILSLDDTLAKWFPDYPKTDEITLRMLVSNTSGYADYVDLDILPLYEDPFRQWTPSELTDLALGRPMKCDPGTCFAYAHTNFVVLGEVMEKASGKPLEQLIREGIIEPLGLRNTRSEETAVIQEPVLHAFDTERGVYENSSYWNPSWTLARGAIMTTDIADLLTSAIAIGTGRLLEPESAMQQLAQPTPLPAGFTDDFYYALGILVSRSWVIQTPSFAGYSAAMAYLPERKLAVAITATSGRDTPLSPRPTDTLFLDLVRNLAPDRVPRIAR